MFSVQGELVVYRGGWELKFCRDSQVTLLHGWLWLQHFQAGLKLSKAVPGNWDGVDSSCDLRFDQVTARSDTDVVKSRGCWLLLWESGLMVELLLCKSTSATQLCGIQAQLGKEHESLQ